MVPVYNVRKFLPKCLDSLAGQTLSEIEIICVNDGSTDDSLEILQKYAKQSKRIKIIDKKNTGYGDSVNCGINEAVGEYIGIVEPDDFVELDTFAKMYEVAKKNDVEVVKANFYKYSTELGRDTGKSNMFLPNEIKKVINPRNNRHIFYQQPSVWSAIYQRNFLKKNNIDFLSTSGASYQDAGFSFKVWAMAERVFFIDKAFLHYRQDNPSSSVKSEGKVYAVKEEYDAVERYLNRHGLMNELGPTLAVVRLGGYIWNMRRLKKDVAVKFAREVEKDYRRYLDAGYLDPKNLDDADAKFIANSIVVKNPKMYLAIRPLYEVWDKFKIWGVGVRNKIKERQ